MDTRIYGLIDWAVGTAATMVGTPRCGVTARIAGGICAVRRPITLVPRAVRAVTLVAAPLAQRAVPAIYFKALSE